MAKILERYLKTFTGRGVTSGFDGPEGLNNKPTIGRHPGISHGRLSKIRTELSKNPSGWKAKEIMDLTHKKTGVRYHEVHIYRFLYKWGFSPKSPRKKFVNTTSNEEKKQFQKRPRK